MTLTLGTAPTFIGPGCRVFVSGVTGPVPNDDFLTVLLTRTVGGQGYTYGTLQPVAAGLNIVTIGYDGLRKRVVNGDTDPPPQGTALSLQAIQYHANATVVDSSAVTAYGSLDSIGYVFGLFQYAGASGTASLDDILAAVRTTFPATS